MLDNYNANILLPLFLALRLQNDTGVCRCRRLPAGVFSISVPPNSTQSLLSHHEQFFMTINHRGIHFFLLKKEDFQEEPHGEEYRYSSIDTRRSEMIKGAAAGDSSTRSTRR